MYSLAKAVNGIILGPNMVFSVSSSELFQYVILDDFLSGVSLGRSRIWNGSVYWDAD